MNKILALTVTVALLFTGGIACAIETPVGNAAGATSPWVYPKERRVADGATSLTGEPAVGALENPHSGYDATSNACRMCHDMSARGVYPLLRASRPDEACVYCHVGGSAYSTLQVYDLNSASMGTANGHTIGAAEVIPDSSVAQWVEPITVTVADADGNTVARNIMVRRYSPTANKLFRFSRYDGPDPIDPSIKGYLRVGPLSLSCMSCHFPHDTEEMVWTPTAMEAPGTTGAKRSYKLLRKSPSGSIHGKTTVRYNNRTHVVDYDEGMKTWRPYTEYNPAAGEFYVDPANAVTVPEETMTAENTGPGHTIYTTFTGLEAGRRGPIADPQTVNEYALSPWCADCHNLNIGYRQDAALEELGFAGHADRTHPAPFIGAHNGPGQCYSCHRNDLPNAPGRNGRPSSLFPGYTSDERHQPCEECHFGTGSYRQVRGNVDGYGTRSDFPHSGQDNAIKLLGPTTKEVSADGAITYGTGVTKNNLDGVCGRCHSGVGINH